ncbi:YdeI/OmpD-associated family protein [Mameliella sediminis]|uniref:YdeI/OmpD-associated family protein n=1 Tax=Mameliella sediminis TaxID=2836866 RepID=UPI001C489BF3|nr:YdeI/OmpD-associated family protein [Mameliella sediminis]MBV7393352.1 YdeI/OmpD-associated family protein [Mameliella sediminis]
MPRAGDLATFFDDQRWGAELRALRGILAATPLDETLKWGAACYTCQGANVAILGGFSDGCRLAFFKGTLIPDPEEALILTGPRSRASMYLRFCSVDEVQARAAQVHDYVARAIAVQESGAKVNFAKDDLDHPEELTEALERDEAFRTAFDALTPGRRRGYLLYFTGAKQATTRAARIEKHRLRILVGKGMHDR